MAMVRCCLVGPVPFKDVNKEEEKAGDVMSPPTPTEEYADIISGLPSISIGSSGLRMRLCQGVWLFEHIVAGMISLQRRFKPRPGNMALASPPKCGTTWLKALAFATMARAAYPPSHAGHPLLRLNPHDCVPDMEDLFRAGEEAKLDVLPSPRLLHTHMHHSMLPPSLAAGKCKIVFVCREPKDMLVSMWHFTKRAIPFPDLFESACEGTNANGPIWDHILGYWSASRATPERVLFLRYEEMLADSVSAVRELARFLGVPFTAAGEAEGPPSSIARLCNIDTMRGLQANATGNTEHFFKTPYQSFRKGVAGDWVNHMTPEMARRMDAIVKDKLQGSGLSF